jgi:hypothetical protein
VFLYLSNKYLVAYVDHRLAATALSVEWLRHGICYSELESRQAQDIPLLWKSSIPALGPTQPHIKPVPAFIPGDNAAGREGNNLPPSSVEIKNEWNSNYTHPTSLHGVERAEYVFLYRRSF